jgi:hypothetical protein
MCILLIKEALKVNVDSPQQSFERLPPGLVPKWVKMGQNRVKNGVRRGAKNGGKNRKIEIRKCKNWDKKQKKMVRKSKKMEPKINKMGVGDRVGWGGEGREGGKKNNK